MGFSSGHIGHLARLGRRRDLSAGARVLDFGSQNIFGTISDEQVHEFLSAFGRDAYFVPNLAGQGAKVEALMAAV